MRVIRMTQKLDRNDPEYIRILELISIVVEEVGEMTQSSNNFLFKGDLSELTNAIKEGNQIFSPLLELIATLESTRIKVNSNKES